MSELKVGDLVLLTLDSPGSLGITYELERFKDRKFRISKIRQVHPGGKTSPWFRGIYYELDGCVSEKGVPFAVTEDWLMPMKELKR